MSESEIPTPPSVESDEIADSDVTVLDPDHGSADVQHCVTEPVTGNMVVCMTGQITEALVSSLWRSIEDNFPCPRKAHRKSIPELTILVRNLLKDVIVPPTKSIRIAVGIALRVLLSVSFDENRAKQILNI